VCNALKVIVASLNRSSETHVRCGGTVNDDFVAYLLVNLTVKEF